MRKSFFLAPARQVNPQTGLGWEPQATKKAGASMGMGMGKPLKSHSGENQKNCN